MNKVRSLEELKKRSIEIHGDVYDFSNFKYVDSKTHGILTCHKKDKFGIEHGDFLITQNQILANRGCPKCAGNARVKKEDVEKRLSVVNTRGYNCDIPDKLDSKTKIKFYCDKGHTFNKYYKDIKMNFLCPHCNPLTTTKYDENGKAITLKSLTTEEFIEKSKKVWGDLIDYSNVKCCGDNKNVVMKCKKHNVVFEQTPYNNLKGFCGCHECVKEKLIKIKHVSFDEFVKRAREIHGDRYDYIEESYISYGRPMNIICKKHGVFSATPNNHIHNKSGCSKCKMSHLENEVMVKLENQKIDYKWQHRDIWLGLQSLDFYIPSKNIAIECQGKQHFGIGCWHGSKEKRIIEFEQIKQRDISKKQKCQDQGIKLIYFLDKEYNGFMTENDIYFNNTDDLMEYINNI